MKKAIVFGASGFVGSHLLDDLLDNAAYEQVTVVVRKPLPISHPKLKTVVDDLQSLPSLKDDLIADEVFLTLGTTKKHTPDPKEYYRIDHDYPLLAAKLAKENGAKSVSVVTGVGSDPASKFSYIRTKGELERDLIALDFSYTHIFQPSMIVGNRNEERAMEKTLIGVWELIDPLFVGGLIRYKGIDGKDIARAMMNAAKNPTEKVKFYRWREMKALL